MQEVAIKESEAGRRGYALRRLASLALGLVTLFVTGLVFAWSVFVTPIALDTGWDSMMLTQNYRVLMIFQAVGCILSSVVQRACNGEPRIPLLVGGALALAGFVLCGTLAGMGIAAVFVFYGAVAALGAGMVFNAVLATMNLWFPDKLGFVSGLQMFLYGIASLFLGVPIDGLMGIVGWRVTLEGLGVAVFVLALAAAFAIKKPPSNIVELFPRKKNAAGEADGADVARSSAAHSSANPYYRTDFGVTLKQFDTMQMMKTPVFWLAVMWFVMLATVGMTLVGESRQDALSLGTDATLATLLVGLVSLFNGGTGVLHGLFLDRFGIVNLVRLCSGLMVAGAAVITCSFAVGSSPLFICGALVTAMGYGAFPVFTTTFPLNRFGREYYAMNCAVGTAFCIPTSIAGMVLTPLFMGDRGLVSMYAGLLCMCVLGLVAAFVLIRRYRKDMDKLVD